MSKIEKLTAVKGMNDVQPKDAALWEYFEDTVSAVLRSYGYAQIRTPIVEYTPLFRRGIGEVTDIVEKEMYAFEDALNGEQLALRPEGTASVCRAVLEHNLLYDGGKRLWYAGPMFRHERPQRGRYRQFYQIGAEALGFGGPDVDAELIFLCARLWEELEIPNVRLTLNSLGDADERARHRADLVAHLERNLDGLDADAKRRMHTNPLRVLDSKTPSVREIADRAPKLIDYLGPDSLAHFTALQRLIKSRGIAYDIDPKLVRGLDYYNRTVFEWVSTSLGAQGTICGGGRYDGLIELLGGKPTPACGFAMGIERVIDLLGQSGFEASPHTDIYVVHAGEGALLLALQAAELLRDQGMDVIVHAGEASFKSQMKKADAAGAVFAVIIGDDEVRASEVTLKPLRDAAGEPIHGAAQERVALTALASRLIGEFGFESNE